MPRSISDFAIVLRRTDYGEKDRILTLLTPKYGKLRALAKAVRSPKSKLAGGIELFAENEVGLVEGRGELHTVTFSRMKRYFGSIAADLDKSAYAYECLKAVNKLAPDNAGGDYYEGLVKLLEALSENKVPFVQIKIWYGLRLLDNLGASPDLNTDSDEAELPEDSGYQYDFDKHCFFPKASGPYKREHIKVLKHLSKTPRPAEIRNLDDNTANSVERLMTLLLSDHIK